MTFGVAVMIVVAMLASPHFVRSSGHEGPTVSADQARKILVEGNKRYVAAKGTHPHQSAARRQEVANGQYPIAVVVSCSDSRVPPEIAFDQGLGDLFVIRLAGNVLNDAALGSIEYAVMHLGVKYIMVLGHEHCGAVDATLHGGDAPGHIGSLVEAIKPAVDRATGKPGDVLDNAVRENISMVVEQLKSAAPILAPLVKSGALKIDGARYDLDDGTVEVF